MPQHKIGPSSIEAFKEDLDENMRYLHHNADKCSDPNFARSLWSYYCKFNGLTEKQLFRATQFWTEAKENDPEVLSGQKLPEIRRADPVINTPINKIALVDLFERFNKAAKYLKYPAVKFNTSKEMYLRFFRTTELNRAGAGNIAVVQGSRTEEKTKVAMLMQATISVRWEEAGRSNLALQAKVKEIVENFLQQVQMNGREYARCCFCNLPLENKSSIYHGYGPICADNYGLPWGDIPQEEIELGVHL